jgi:hypothetical protein
MSDKNGGLAFPTEGVVCRDGILYEGMTLRDYFAAKAMLGIMSDPSEVQSYTNEQLAQWAYQVADAMIKARDE